MKFKESDRLRAKVQKLIPAGAHTYSKGDDQFPQLSPGFIIRGSGTTVWDPDGNEFLDWGMGLRSVSLGHAYKPILDVVREQLDFGVNFTRPSTLEAELAEMLVDLIPSAEMVKFSKNGSDVTTAAVKLARAYTGRDIILRCAEQPFFSVNDWFIGDTACNAGIPKAVQEMTKRFSYNNIESLIDALERYKGQVACIIIEPASLEHPQNGFLEKVRSLASEHGAILIFDEMISGFRWHQSGAQAYYGVTPDLATFGKAIANGFAIAALVGRADIMELGGITHDKPRVFLLSTTNGGETHALAAAKKTIELIKDGEIIKQNWLKGKQLMNGFNSLASEFGIASQVKMLGVECSPYQIFLNNKGTVDLSLRTLYLQEMIQQGVLIPYISISHSHTDCDIDKTLEASRNSMKVLRQAIEQGCTDGLLVGPAVKPVFRKYN